MKMPSNRTWWVSLQSPPPPLLHGPFGCTYSFLSSWNPPVDDPSRLFSSVRLLSPVQLTFVPSDSSAYEPILLRPVRHTLLFLIGGLGRASSPSVSSGRKRSTPETWLADMTMPGNGMIKLVRWARPPASFLSSGHDLDRLAASMAKLVVESEVTVIACGMLNTPGFPRRGRLKNQSIGQRLHSTRLSWHGVTSLTRLCLETSCVLRRRATKTTPPS